MTTKLTINEQLQHNHGTVLVTGKRRTALGWCGTCRDWFVPLSKAERNQLLESQRDATQARRDQMLAGKSV